VELKTPVKINLLGHEATISYISARLRDNTKILQYEEVGQFLSRLKATVSFARFYERS